MKLCSLVLHRDYRLIPSLTPPADSPSLSPTSWTVVVLHFIEYYSHGEHTVQTFFYFIFEYMTWVPWNQFGSSILSSHVVFSQLVFIFSIVFAFSFTILPLVSLLVLLVQWVSLLPRKSSFLLPFPPETDNCSLFNFSFQKLDSLCANFYLLHSLSLQFLVRPASCPSATMSLLPNLYIAGWANGPGGCQVACFNVKNYKCSSICFEKGEKAQ